MSLVSAVSRLAAVGVAAAVALVLSVRAPAQDSFASRIAALSEEPGYFDTDNLISNEGSYLHVVTALGRDKIRGGAYIGVGPDQNFSYIASIRPSVAFIIDVRRDNLLLHLLFKALFDLSRTRVEFLALLLSRPVPEPLEPWHAKTIEELTTYIDSASAASVAAVRSRVTERIRGFGVALSEQDLLTIDRFHRRFIEEGLNLQFHSTGRPPQSYYPTYRQLLLETDLDGRRSNYLASEAGFQFVKSLEARDLVIPVVGNLNGSNALSAIGRFLNERHERLMAFYASNVEYYLFSEGTFQRFVENLGRLPRADRAVIIRSIFRGAIRVTSGYGSVSTTQPIGELVDGYARGRYHEYWELAGK